MCGISGFITKNSFLADEVSFLRKMTDTLYHRGPDDFGVWHDEQNGVGLGQRRLSIIDLSPLGHQPMHSACGRYVIVFNGEIYNYRELKISLETKGHQFVGHSDTEVMLALVTEHGIEKALSMMSGMFAFALWDKAEKILHLARDRIGEKPLYYGLVNDTFVFGSELKALRAYPNFQNEIDKNSVSLLLQYGYIPAPKTIHKNIHKLTPGTYLTIPADNITNFSSPKIYWSAVACARDGLKNPLNLNDDQAIQHLDNLLHHTIKNCMVSDVPIGAFLSGGIDSSVVAALMQANSDRPIKTFTIGFNEAGYNEAVYADAVAKHLKTDHTELYVDAAHALSLIPRLSSIYDEPFADSSAIPTFLVSQLTKQHVTVCLSGDGGDEVFGGYNRYLLGKNLWKKISLFPYPMRLAIKKMLLSVSPAKWDKVLAILRKPLIGDKIHKLGSALAIKSPELLYQRLVSQWPNAAIAMKGFDVSQNPDEVLLDKQQEMDFIENMMMTDTITYLPDDIMVKVDRAGMAVSLESRAPYLDHQLIEFMWRLPLHMKIRNGETKWLLRRVLEKHVPKHLFDRPKMGFGVPIDSWLRGPLKNWAGDLLNQSTLEQQGFFNTTPILEKWNQHLSGNYNWQYQLWPVLMFQSWYENNKYASKI